MQQEIVTTKITKNDGALTTVNTADYNISYYGFITLGNTNDTVTVTLNGVTGLILSMIGYTECPITSIQVTDDMDSSNTGVQKGLLVFGVKTYKSIF